MNTKEQIKDIFEKLYRVFREKKEEITYNDIVKETKINRTSIISYIIPFLVYEVVKFKRIARCKLFYLTENHEEKYKKMIEDLEKKGVLEIFYR